MDVPKRDTKKNNKVKYLLGFLALFLLIIFLLQGQENKIDYTNIVTSKVQKGDLNIEVNGYGTLVANDVVVLTALTNSTITRVHVKPGAVVDKDTVILSLQNPELEQEVIIARQKLSQAQANYRQIKLGNKQKVLKSAAEIAKLESEYESQSFILKSQAKLVDSGIVSTVDYEKQRLLVKKDKKLIEIERELSSQLHLVNVESESIAEEQIKQAEVELKIVENRLDSLELRASISGVLQKLSVELGQSITAGQELATVGSRGDLSAIIKVPQSQAHLLKLGQSGVVKNTTEAVEAKVIRIDPRVEDNSVNVELAMNELPSSFRPELAINGSILVDSFKDVLYIDIPHTKMNKNDTKLYKLDGDKMTAQLTPVELGYANNKIVQIHNAKLGEEFIVSGVPDGNSNQLYIR